MLINPQIDDEIVWVCDGCEDMLNLQTGFNEDCGEWICEKCGCVNKIDSSEIYLTEDEFQMSLKNPYKGMSDEAIIEVMGYQEVELIGDRPDIILVQNPDEDRLYVKKILTTYDSTVYRYLIKKPVHNMPRLKAVYEGDKHLIVIEEYIEGRTLSDIISEGVLDLKNAVRVARKIADIAATLHNLPMPIIHRDIKPSNVIIAEDNEVYLLDINAAKWFRPDESEDTHLLGTMYYAAPEQAGYGFSASSMKTDIYALGILLNVMLTGKIPKEKRASGEVWNIIERCIAFEVDDRYTDMELIEELDKLLV